MSAGKEKSYPGFQMGTSFLLVLFVIICLVLLGVLSLSEALRDKGYSDRIAEKTRLYYKAVSEAQHKLGEIDKMLDGIGKTYEDYGMYLESAGMIASKLDGVVCREDEEQLVLSYQVSITDSQSLFVEVEILNPEKGEGNYKIVKWQEASEDIWEEEGTLPVLRFDEE